MSDCCMTAANSSLSYFTGYAEKGTLLGFREGQGLTICTLSEPPRLDTRLKSWDLLPGLGLDPPWHSSQADDLSHTPCHSAERRDRSQHSSLCDVRRASCAQGHSALLSKSDRLKWLWNSHSLCCWHVSNDKKASSGPKVLQKALCGGVVVRGARKARGGY